MLNKDGERGHPYLIPDLRGKAFNLSLSSMMFTMGFNNSFLKFSVIRGLTHPGA